jgi:hypothetical protein
MIHPMAAAVGRGAEGQWRQIDLLRCAGRGRTPNPLVLRTTQKKPEKPWPSRQMPALRAAAASFCPGRCKSATHSVRTDTLKDDITAEGVIWLEAPNRKRKRKTEERGQGQGR